MKVIKSTVEKWHIRRENGWWCGNFLFDNRNGELCIHSDWGNWNYLWHAMGEGIDLKNFLLDIEPDYLMSKLASESERRWFDKDATIKELKRKIIELRRNDDLDEDIAREHWEELEDFNDIETGEGYQAKFWDTQYLRQMYYDYADYPYVTDYHPRLRAFVRDGWPLFIQAIKEELNEVAR